MPDRTSTPVLVALGMALAVIGALDAVERSYEPLATTAMRLLFAGSLGLGVALGRALPSAALAAVWISCLVQISAGLDLSVIQIGVAVVAFHTSRYGSVGCLWASGLSIPAAYLIGATYVLARGTELATTLGISDLAGRNAAPLVVLVAAGSLPLAVPWLLGLVLRMRERAGQNRVSQLQAEAETARAEELAAVREEQARLARDVHDVVGHSLAVILAQAESAAYLPDPDTATLHQALATIATSARTSLGDVRRVLGDGEVGPAPDDPFASLLDPLAAATGRVEVDVLGVPRVLPPDQRTTAYRVLQEMLTNAVKHGTAGTTIQICLDWRHGLGLEVTNSFAEREGGSGLGLAGMHRRLAGVGGRLEVTEDVGSYRVRGWMPTGMGTGPAPGTEEALR